MILVTFHILIFCNRVSDTEVLSVFLSLSDDVKYDVSNTVYNSKRIISYLYYIVFNVIS